MCGEGLRCPGKGSGVRQRRVGTHSPVPIPSHPIPSLPSPGLYQELHLEQLTVAELSGKLAELLALPPGQILRLSRQGPAGIHVLVSDAVRTRGQPGRGGTEPAPSRPLGDPSAGAGPGLSPS